MTQIGAPGEIMIGTAGLILVKKKRIHGEELSFEKTRILAVMAVVAASFGVHAHAALKSREDSGAGVRSARRGGLQTAVVAGGCFWGVQGVYRASEGRE